MARTPSATLSPTDLAARLGLEGALAHLEEALTHPSFANEQRRGPRIDNQRLEFLGDAVLGRVVAEALGSAHPDLDEGARSSWRAGPKATRASSRSCARAS